MDQAAATAVALEPLEPRPLALRRDAAARWRALATGRGALPGGEAEEEVINIADRNAVAQADAATLRALAEALAPGAAGAGMARVHLRLLGCLPELARRLERLEEEQACGEEAAAEDLLGLLLPLCRDAECAQELGDALAHRTLRRASKSLDAPWTEPRVAELVAECVSATLGALGALVSAPRVGALDERPRPFVVRLERGGACCRVALRQVPEDRSEATAFDRANVRVGYRLWGAAVVLAGLVRDMGAAGALRDKSVLEIGAGLGLCGLVAAWPAFGAREVVLSDFHPRIVDNLQHNIELNRACEAGPGETVRAELLDWEAVDPNHATFDLVVGSDLVCEERDCELVAGVLQVVLKAQGVALVTLGSQASRFGVERFEAILSDRGLCVKEESEGLFVPAACLPPNEAEAGSEGKGEAGEGEGEGAVFIGTARGYRHFQVRKKPACGLIH